MPARKGALGGEKKGGEERKRGRLLHTLPRACLLSPQGMWDPTDLALSQFCQKKVWGWGEEVSQDGREGL